MSSRSAGVWMEPAANAAWCETVYERARRSERWACRIDVSRPPVNERWLAARVGTSGQTDRQASRQPDRQVDKSGIPYYSTVQYCTV